MATHVRRGTGQAAGPSTSGGSGNATRPLSGQFEKQDQKTVRRIAKRGQIERTEDIVRVYNAATTGDERKLLFDWLNRYHETFVERAKQGVSLKMVLEYAQLAKIKPPQNDSFECKDFFRSIVGGLSEAVPEQDLPKANDCAKAVLQIFANIDTKVLESATSELRSLAEKLMACVSYRLRLTKDEFVKNSYVLHALHHTLVLCYTIRAQIYADAEKFEMEQMFKEKWDRIKKFWRHCYPARYLLKLIEQAIRRLYVEDGESCCDNILRVFMPSMCGFIYLFRGVYLWAKCECDPEPFEEAWRRFLECDRNRRAAEEEWYDRMQNLSHSAVEVVKQPAKLELLKKGYDNTKVFAQRVRRREDCKAIRFGLIGKLRYVAECSQAPDVREFVKEKLLDLIAGPAPEKGWIKDSDILGAFLQALHALCREEEYRTEIASKLKELFEALKNTSKQKTMTQWLNNRSVEDALGDHPPSQDEVGDDLFHAVRRDVGLKLTLKQMQENIDALKEHYKNPIFCEVGSLFAQEEAKHVKGFEFYTVVYQKRPENEDDSGGINEDDHTSVFYARKQQQKKAIGLKEFFHDRALEPNTPAKEIRKMLLFGNPGTGKTCISRFIAHDWAEGGYQGEFDAVYVLFVRELTGETFKGQGLRAQQTLECAVSRLRFEYRNDDELTDGLQTQIDDDLDEPTTLLIVDGLDEGDKCGQDMVISAYKRTCKVLLTSRPYDLGGVRKNVEFEVECHGLSEAQLHRFIDKELGEESSELVNVLTPNPNIWEIAHVPVTANIICFLWKEGKEPFKRENITRSVWKLYSVMVNYVWDRFIKNHERFKSIAREDIFDALSLIAFRALREGKILIHKDDVRKASKSNEEQEIFEKCGFLLLQLEGTKYQFPHLTFQEFFAGRFIADVQWGHNNKQNCSDLCTLESKAVGKFLQDSKYMQKRKVTVSFMAEKVFEETATFDVFHHMSKTVDELPVDLIGMQHVCAKLRLLEATFASANVDVHSGLQKDSEVKKLLDSVIPLIEEHQNDPVMGDILMRNFKEIPNLLKQFTELVEPMTKMLEERPTLHIRIFQQAIEIIKYVPDHMDRVKQVLKMNAENKDDKTRAMSMAQISSVINVAPLYGERVLDLLMKGFEDESPTVRGAAIAQIATVILARPHTTPDLLQMVKNGAEDEEVYPRACTLQQVSAIMEAAPEHYKDLLEILDEGAKDPHADGRAAAMSQIADVLALVPERAEHFKEIMIKGNEDDDRSVRAATMSQAARFGCMQIQYADHFLDMIEDAFNDKAVVRVTALQNISGIVYALEGSNRRVLRVIYNGVRDKHKNVNEAAIRQIPNFAKAAPEEHAYLMRLIKNRLRRYEHLLPQTPEQLIGASEEVIRNTLLQLLDNDSEDADERLRRRAEKMVREMTLEDLVECYWDHPNGHVVKAIAALLLDTAVSVFPGQGDKLKLTAYRLKLDPICEMRKEDIDRLLSDVDGALEETYPGFFMLNEIKRLKDGREQMIHGASQTSEAPTTSNS